MSIENRTHLTSANEVIAIGQELQEVKDARVQVEGPDDHEALDEREKALWARLGELGVTRGLGKPESEVQTSQKKLVQGAREFGDRMRETHTVTVDSRGNVMTPSQMEEIAENGVDKDDVVTRA